MSDVKRIKTPWAYHYDDNGFFYIDGDEFVSPYIVATGGESDSDEANAKFIVEACNSYADAQATVEALQRENAQLKALVRAVSDTMEPFRKSLAKLDEVDTLATRRIAEADAYYCAQRVLTTLDATTPAGQRWTRERPTEPGWYWWRRTGFEASMLNVYESPIGLRMWLPGEEEKGGSIAVDQCYDDTEFLGPLTPNEATE